MKHPSFLLVNDLHVDKNCIEDFNLNWDEMLEQCKANKVSSVAIGGDIFTSRSSQTLDVLMTVRDAFERAERAGVTLWIALGNHDLLDQEATYGYPDIFDSHGNVCLINNKPEILEVGGDFYLAIMRYWKEETTFPGKMEELREILSEKNIDPSQVILYIHEGIHGGLGDFEAPNEVPQEVFKGFKSVLVGHYHNRKKIDGTQIEYIGSSRQANFGEDEHKGYTLLWSDGTHSFIENQVNTRYVTFEKDFEELNNAALKAISEWRDDDYKIRLKINCTDAQSKLIDKQALFAAGVTKIEAETEETKVEKVTDEDLSKKFDKKGIQTEYETYCNGKNISSELGMKYLNQI